MSKINGHTVRGGWSKVVWDCEVDGKKFSLFAESGSEITPAQMRAWKNKIEAQGITPTAPFTMLKVTTNGQLTGAK